MEMTPEAIAVAVRRVLPSVRADAGLLDGVHLIGTGSLTERLWARPAIAVIGVDAPAVGAASNTLIPAARAKVSLRVAPGDDAARARAALVTHLTTSAPWGVRVTAVPGGTVAPYAARAGGRAYQAAHAALAAAWGRPAVDIGVGGSVAFVTAYAAAFGDAEILPGRGAAARPPGRDRLGTRKGTPRGQAGQYHIGRHKITCHGGGTIRCRRGRCQPVARARVAALPRCL